MKYTDRDFEAMERRIWEVELVLEQTYPQLLRAAREGLKPPVPENPKDSATPPTQPGQQTPQAPGGIP